MLAPPAHGGLVTASGHTFRFDAHAGEANRVAISLSIQAEATAAEIRIIDTGAVLTAGAGCRSLDANSASCVVPVLISVDDRGPPIVQGVIVKANLGDGTDTGTVSGSGILGRDSLLRGGADADSLSVADWVPLDESFRDDGVWLSASDLVVLGDGGDDVLTGGAADDTFEGGDGNDRISAGAGNDWIFEGPGDDRIDGGARGVSRGPGGGDYVGYERAPRGIVGNLATGAFSGWGNDEVTDVEAVAGSRYGGDILIGDERANDLYGVGGDDRILGRGGGDRLFGFAGADRLDGGFGNDDVVGGSGDDVLRGGHGRDRMYGESGDDRLLARDRTHDRLSGHTGQDCAIFDRNVDWLRNIELIPCRRLNALAGRNPNRS